MLDTYVGKMYLLCLRFLVPGWMFTVIEVAVYIFGKGVSDGTRKLYFDVAVTSYNCQCVSECVKD